MSATGEARNYKLDSAVVASGLALLSLVWFGLSFVTTLPVTFSSEDYTLAIFPAIGFGLLSIFLGGFAWVEFPIGDKSREARLARAAMFVGAAAIVIVLGALLIPQISTIDISSD